MVGGAGLFLTFWRSLGGSLAEEVVFMKHTFLTKKENIAKKVSTTLNNTISN